MEKLHNSNITHERTVTEFLFKLSQQLEDSKSAIETGETFNDFIGSYLQRISIFIETKDQEGLQKCMETLIHFLPENVSSLSIPLAVGEDSIIITSKRDTTFSEDKQENWELSNLMQYATKAKFDFPNTNID